MQVFTVRPDLFGGRFSYDATETTNRRRAPKTIVKSEDEHLQPWQRKTLVATTRDSRRNFTVFRWALNKHLDFVVRHNFRSRSNDRDFDKRLEKFVRKISKKGAFDVTGRHPLRRALRIFEAGRVVDGDALAVKIAGGFQQFLEGDRIRDPDLTNRAPGERWEHGLRISSFGSVDRFCIHSRTRGGGFKFERKIDASRAFFFGYFDRSDQYRGISPMASAVNMLVALYQGLDFASAKMLISQLIAFAIYRRADTLFGGGVYDEDGQPAVGTQYKVDFSKGPNFLDMDPGDKAEFLESKSPAMETANFWETLTSITLKALDIPFSFYSEDFTNFFGSRAALNLYLKSTDDKKEDVREYLDDWTAWRLGLAQANGEFDFPVGWDPSLELWDWVPSGFPWWNPVQEITAAEKALALKLRSRTEIRKETYGDDWLDVADEIDEEDQYLEELEAQKALRLEKRRAAGEPGMEEDPDEETEEEPAQNGAEIVQK